MTLSLFRRIEFWFISTIFSITFGKTIYDQYAHSQGILQKLELAELRRISKLYDWQTNGLAPLLVLGLAIYVVWLLLSRVFLSRYTHATRYQTLIYVISVLGLIFGAVVYYLSFWKDLDYRYVVDWCGENGHEWVDRQIIGAKVRSPFRWLNVFFLIADIVMKLGLYLGISQLFQWSLQQPENEENINAKILKEGSILALIALIVVVTLQLPHFHLFGTQFLFALAGFGHSYLFYKNILRRPEKTEIKRFRQDWLIFLIYALIASTLLSVAEYVSDSIYQYRYVGDYQYGYRRYYPMSPLNFIINNFIFVVFVAIGSVLLRLLAVRPWQIRFRGKQAELAGLQSQVNPHFLFNALNTLYASAIIENAERTSGGIQKLSDMMRFMLHENNKTQIDIRQEVNYLKNYIDLQQLRTSGIKDFELKTDLDDTLCLQSIAPMLLVPFVENAFKHGISMRQKSWIDIKLRCDGQQLYFAVFNSFHPKSDQDPERNASGIGLENVKKRLQLLYPKKHQLSIHQTEREFSINLTVKLK